MNNGNGNTIKAVANFKRAITRCINSPKTGLNAHMRSAIKQRIYEVRCWQFFDSLSSEAKKTFPECLAELADITQERPWLTTGYTCEISYDLKNLFVCLDGTCIAAAWLKHNPGEA